MVNLKIYILLILTIAIYSCDSKVTSNVGKGNDTSENKISSNSFQIDSKKEIKFRDTININYAKHKTLLDILKILPDATMGSWNWSKKDRIETVGFIEKNNYLIDSTKMFNTIKYIKPNSIGIQVFDGFWTLSIYEFKDNHYFIVTNDIVGDGNDIQTYNFINNKLSPLKMINWFEGFEYKLLLNNSANCIESLEEHQLSYNYNFKDKNGVEISSWSINESESDNCFKGNSIKYQLNKENKTFDIVYVYWKKDGD